MNCLICGGATSYRFCADHAPKFGDNVRVDGMSIYVGTIPVSKVIFDFWHGTKSIKWWMGTDVLTLFSYPPYRSKIKVFLHRVKMLILSCFIYEHWFVSLNLIDEIPSKYVWKPRGEIFYLNSPSKFKIRKVQEHTGTNILVYCPNRDKFEEWLYGWDIVKWLMNIYPNFNWHVVDGSQNMNAIYPLIDLYIRPTRHDGEPKMIPECKINGIPYYWSRDGKPEVHKIKEFIEKNTGLIPSDFLLKE